MKFTTILLYLFIVSCKLFAQDQYAHTSSGKLVILRSNGTWEYVTNPSLQSPNNLKAQQPVPKTTQTKNKSTSKRKYIRGPRGGCYYINSKGNKVYVDRSLCD
jgi:hypothetical protein